MTLSIDQFRLDGKTAIVTGAGGRDNSIGRAYALGLRRYRRAYRLYREGAALDRWVKEEVLF